MYSINIWIGDNGKLYEQDVEMEIIAYAMDIEVSQKKMKTKQLTVQNVVLRLLALDREF